MCTNLLEQDKDINITKRACSKVKEFTEIATYTTSGQIAEEIERHIVHKG